MKMGNLLILQSRISIYS